MKNTKNPSPSKRTFFILLSAANFFCFSFSPSLKAGEDPAPRLPSQLAGIEGIELLPDGKGKYKISGTLYRTSDRERLRAFVDANSSKVHDETRLSDSALRPILRRLQERAKQENANVQIRIKGSSFIVSGSDATSVLPSLKEIYSDLNIEGGPVLSLSRGAGIQPTIFLEIALVEVKKSAMRALGPRVNSPIGFEMGGDFQFLQSAKRVLMLSSDPIRGFLDLALRRGEARVHAKQSVVTENGKEGHLTMGGEFPIRVSGKENGDVIFKEYGLILRFTPHLGSGQSVHLQVFSEMSDIDMDNAVEGLPAIRKRVLNTQVYARLDEMMAIGGLVRSDQASLKRGIPFLSEIPGLGRLFRSDAFRNDKSEAFIFITPKRMEKAWMPSPEL